MNKLVFLFLSVMVLGSTLEACVHYSPTTGTYTIDRSGSVEFDRD